MIIAKGTVIVNGKEYVKGQAVVGLSGTDADWMKRSGFIEEIPDEKKPDKGEGKAKK